MNTDNRGGENSSIEQDIDSGRISGQSSDKRSNLIDSPEQIETK